MADLFTLTELASLYQGDLDTATATLARELAVGLIEDEVGPLEETTSVITLPIGRDGLIDIPVNALTDVTDVAITGSSSTWEWKRPFPQVQLKAWTPPQDTVWYTADVTVVHGWVTPPAVLKAIGLSVAQRIYDNPHGLRTEASQLDDHQESQTRAGSDDDLAGITLTQAELDRLERFRPGVFVTGR